MAFLVFQRTTDRLFLFTANKPRAADAFPNLVSLFGNWMFDSAGFLYRWNTFAKLLHPDIKTVDMASVFHPWRIVGEIAMERGKRNFKGEAHNLFIGNNGINYYISEYRRAVSAS